MNKAENASIQDAREKQGSIWSDRKHHLWFPFSFTKYSVENGRIYINSGFIASREDECLLYRILDISLTRTLAQRIFGTGTIELNTTDRSTPIIRIENIKRPVQVKRMLSNLIEEDRNEKKVVGKDMYGASNHLDPHFHEDGAFHPDDCDDDFDHHSN